MKMQCADEDGAVRNFTPEVYEGKETGDYTCSHCGWMQRSFDAGKIELAFAALTTNYEQATESELMDTIDAAKSILSLPVTLDK